MTVSQQGYGSEWQRVVRELQRAIEDMDGHVVRSILAKHPDLRRCAPRSIRWVLWGDSE